IETMQQLDQTGTRAVPSSKRQEELLPWDLSEWIEKGTLAEWIKSDLESLDWSNPELVKYLKANPGYRPKMMLTLLTYAYATKVYDSESIVRHCDSDKIYRAICENDPPRPNAVSRFRRENRSLLKWCLVQL